MSWLNCLSFLTSMCNGNTERSPIAVEEPLNKSVSVGMIESASMYIKNELKRANFCTKGLDTSFIYLGFLNVTSWSCINRRNKPKHLDYELKRSRPLSREFCKHILS